MAPQFQSAKLCPAVPYLPRLRSGFSSSSAPRRLASDTSMRPYLAFQFYSVASDIPCLRARSLVFAPRAPAPENLLFREPDRYTVRPLLVEQNLLINGGKLGSRSPRRKI